MFPCLAMWKSKLANQNQLLNGTFFHQLFPPCFRPCNKSALCLHTLVELFYLFNCLLFPHHFQHSQLISFFAWNHQTSESCLLLITLILRFFCNTPQNFQSLCIEIILSFMLQLFLRSGTKYSFHGSILINSTNMIFFDISFACLPSMICVFQFFSSKATAKFRSVF